MLTKTFTMPFPRLLDRAWAAWRSDGTPSLRRLPGFVRQRSTRKLRVAWWHLRSAMRSWWIRAGPRRAGGPPDASAPAFDLLGYNPIGRRPIGRRREAGGEVAAPGPVGWLPSGAEFGRVVLRRSLRRLRRIHHPKDVRAVHADAATCAGELIRLAASGALVHLADGGQRLRPLLGGDLHRLMTTDVRSLDAAARELLGVRMCRAALREHSSWARARRMGEERFPPVSILLATRRPRFLSWALANVARQDYPEVELVLALHGEGFTGVEERVAELPHPARVLRAPADEPLGAVLNAATEASGGTLLAKMDDDDMYGAEHIWDLVLAREYSGAQLVGKSLEFIYLAASDRTIHRRYEGCERYRTASPGGGALLISRNDLDRAGGWRNLPGGVDVALAEDTLRARGCVYHTSGAGFMLVRHGYRHTWNTEEVSDASLLAGAHRVWPGLQPGRAGIQAPVMPYPAPAPPRGASGLPSRRA